MVKDQEVYKVLKEAFPGLDEGQFKIMKETQHPYWTQAVAEVENREEICR